MSTDQLPDAAPIAAEDGVNPDLPSPDRLTTFTTDTGLSGDGAPKGGRAWRSALFVILLLTILVSAAWFLISIESPNDTGPKLTHKISRGDLSVTVTEQGTLESSENAEIKCRIRGFSTVTWIIESGSIVEPGDELVRIDTKRIEDAISLHTTDSHTARATLERSKANLAQAEIAEAAYLEGRYMSQKTALEREVKIAETNLESSIKMLTHSKSMFNRGYVSDLEVEGNEFTVTQAKLELEVKQTQLNVLERYTKEMELETIRGNLTASKSKLQADEAGLAMDEGRRDRAMRELDFCVIHAERGGMVIYPSAAAWKDTPDVTEGATVRRDQVLLLMPDLTKMQVKVGIHESMIDRLRPGMTAKVTLTAESFDGQVVSVASVARPAGWWTGNVVKYDTIISIPERDGLRPGMSAEVEVVLAEHRDVLTVPVAAVVETELEQLCWIKTPDGLERRSVLLGDGNDVFIVVNAGLEEGEEVVLNPRAFIDEAQAEALTAPGQSLPTENNSHAGEAAQPSEEPAHVE